MGYEITYNRVAIKVGEDKYVLLIQTGSNNCFEVNYRGREIAEKNWFQYPFHGRNIKESPYVSASDVEKQLQLEVEKYSYENGFFGIHKTRYTPWKVSSYCTWVRNAIKNSRTVEELVELNGPFPICTRRAGNNPDGDAYPYSYTDDKFIRTTEELVDYLDKVSADEKALGISWRLDRDFRISPKKTRNRRQKEQVSFFFVLQRNDGSKQFFLQRTRKGTYYVYRETDARKFKTEKAAQQFLKRSTYGLSNSFGLVKRVGASAWV